jgi:hypothetical protein
VDDRIPYTYLIGWSNLNVWYYGVRFAKHCDPADLMRTYFTSSKYVKLTIETYGLPDIVEIRKTFDSIESAREWEHCVLRRMMVTEKDEWLNKSDGLSIPPQTGTIHYAYQKGFTDSHKANISSSRMGKYKGADNPFYGKTHSDEFKKAQSERQKASKGMYHRSEESKERTSAALKGRKKSDTHKLKVGEAHKNLLTCWDIEDSKFVKIHKDAYQAEKNVRYFHYMTSTAKAAAAKLKQEMI